MIKEPPKIRTIKKKIPKSLKEQIWITNFGKTFEHKCYVTWCTNNINVFDFDSGHNIPESKGGATSLHNLKPICSRCNKSMSSQYSIDEFIKLSSPYKHYSFITWLLNYCRRY